MILCVNLNPCVDKSVYLERLRPGEIQTASRVTITIGGKANNVARVLAAYGRDAVAMNFFGGETGRLCERLLKEDDHLPTETIWTKSPTREIITIYESEKGIHTDIKEPSPVILQQECEEFVERYRALVPRAEWVAFGGSSPCPCVDRLPADLARLAREAGVPFVLDSSGTALALGLDERPFMVKPNAAEAQALFGVKIDALEQGVDALDRLAAKADLAVLSRGEEGFLASYKNLKHRVHPPKIKAVNAVGSGDALVAGVIIGLSDRKPIEEALALAAAAAAANAGSALTCKITPADVAALVSGVRVETVN